MRCLYCRNTCRAAHAFQAKSRSKRELNKQDNKSDISYQNGVARLHELAWLKSCSFTVRCRQMALMF